MHYTPIPRAFVRWFARATQGDASQGAVILKSMFVSGSPDSVVWQALEATGDLEYSPATFTKAARLILDAVEGSNQ